MNDSIASPPASPIAVLMANPMPIAMGTPMATPIGSRVARLGVITVMLGSIWPALGAPASRHAAAQPAFDGVVIEVIDGKRLRVQPTGQAPVLVVIRDIDPPEPCQAWGAESRRELESLVLNKGVRVRPAGQAPGGAVLASVIVDGIDVGPHQVQEGHAWSIRTRWDRGPLVKQETLARSLDRGLFSQRGAISPKEFRRAQGPCTPPAAKGAR